MGINTIKAIIGVGILIVLFLALQKPLKNRKAIKRFSIVNPNVLRLHLILMLSFQVGQIVDPNNFGFYVTGFDAVVFSTAVYLYVKTTKGIQRPESG